MGKLTLAAHDQKLVIVGAGTASWIAAVAFHKFAGIEDITIVEGTKGPIGVGEGTTPHFAEVLRNWLGCSDAEFFKETNSTVKLGNKFEGWGKEDYLNPIDKEFRSAPADIWPETIDAKRVYAVANNLSVCTSPFLELCERNQIPAVKETHAYHFDQTLVAKFFKKRLPKVKLVHQDVVDVVISDNNIDHLVLSDGTSLKGTFYIDATGFARVLMNKLGAKFIDFSKYLPLTSAVAYSRPQDPVIKPYTTVTAYSEGWHWTIPLQDRNGCGFLYNNSITKREEINQFLPQGAFDVRDIKFTPGFLDRSFIGNCLAIGLASGFVEPLEATSIHGTIAQLWVWLKEFHHPTDLVKFSEKSWTRHHQDYWYSVLDWIQLHYVGVSTNGKFWDHMKTVEKTDKVNEIIDLCKTRMPRPSDFDNPYLIWQHTLTMNILQGNNVLDSKVAQQELDLYELHDYAKRQYDLAKAVKIPGMKNGG